MSFGLQMVILSSLYASVPDYPAKNPELTYFNIIWTMIKVSLVLCFARHLLTLYPQFSVTEPVLVQSCLVGGVSSAVFASFWVSSTFLLSDVYNYNSLEIGLFALIGIAGVSAAPFIGKGIDRLVGWYGVLLGISLVLLSQVIYIVAAGTSIVAFAFVILFLDIGQQTQQVGIFSPSPFSIARSHNTSHRSPTVPESLRSTLQRDLDFRQFVSLHFPVKVLH